MSVPRPGMPTDWPCSTPGTDWAREASSLVYLTVYLLLLAPALLAAAGPRLARHLAPAAAARALAATAAVAAVATVATVGGLVVLAAGGLGRTGEVLAYTRPDPAALAAADPVPRTLGVLAAALLACALVRPCPHNVAPPRDPRPVGAAGAARGRGPGGAGRRASRRVRAARPPRSDRGLLRHAAGPARRRARRTAGPRARAPRPPPPWLRRPQPGSVRSQPATAHSRRPPGLRPGTLGGRGRRPGRGQPPAGGPLPGPRRLRRPARVRPGRWPTCGTR